MMRRAGTNGNDHVLTTLVLGAAFALGIVSAWYQVSLLLATTASVCVCLVVLGARRYRVLGINAALTIALVLTAEYVARPLYILSNSTWGWDTTTFRHITASSGVLLEALTWALLGCLALAAPLVLTGHRHVQRKLPEPPGGSIVLILLGGIGMSVLGVLMGSLAGTDLAVRRTNVGGYLYALNFAPSAALLAALVTMSKKDFYRPRNQLMLLGMGVATLAGYAAFTGGRSEMLTLALGASVIVSRRFYRPSLPIVAVAVVLFVSLAGLYRVVVREPSYQSNRGHSVGDLVERATAAPTRTILAGGDITAFDKLLFSAQVQDRLVPADGGTTIAALLAPVPRSIFANKPAGGNEYFTHEVLQRPRLNTFALVGISLFGEGWVNFRLPGVVLYAVAFGLAVMWLERRSSRGPLWFLAYAILLARLPGFLRGDVYHGAIGFGIVFALAVILLTLAHAIARDRPTWQADASLTPTIS